MTLYEEIKNGLESGIEAYRNNTELKKTIVSNDDTKDHSEEEPPKEG